MIALIQRVTCGQVEIDNQTVAKIDQGIVALVAIEKNDTDRQVTRIFERMVNYRIFADNTGRMNLSLLDVNGGLILVPQFTLVADTQRGNRPDFSDNPRPASARDFFNRLTHYASQQYHHVQHGIFGARMQVTLTNDGPVTFWLQV